MDLYNPDEPDCNGETIGSNQTIGPVTFFSCLSYTYKPIDREKKTAKKEKSVREAAQWKKEQKKKEQILRKKVEKDL